MKNLKPIHKLLIVVAVVIIIAVVVKRRKKAKEEAAMPPTTTSSPTGNIGSAISNANVITDSTVFYAKTPYKKDDRIGWIQSTYNSYAKQRKAAGKTPDWPQITVDKVYGPQTANAVYRAMGKYHTSWKDFKARIDYFKTQL